VPAPKIDPKRTKTFLTANQLCERWGNCSSMFIERRLKDPKFPQPIKLGGRIRFFALDQIEAYERSRIRADEAA
jgi:predicted DNA-binding transcriptional regulator AlpA